MLKISGENVNFVIFCFLEKTVRYEEKKLTLYKLLNLEVY